MSTVQTGVALPPTSRAVDRPAPRLPRTTSDRASTPRQAPTRGRSEGRTRRPRAVALTPRLSSAGPATLRGPLGRRGVLGRRPPRASGGPSRTGRTRGRPSGTGRRSRRRCGRTGSGSGGCRRAVRRWSRKSRVQRVACRGSSGTTREIVSGSKPAATRLGRQIGMWPPFTSDRDRVQQDADERQAQARLRPVDPEADEQEPERQGEQRQPEGLGELDPGPDRPLRREPDDDGEEEERDPAQPDLGEVRDVAADEQADDRPATMPPISIGAQAPGSAAVTPPTRRAVAVVVGTAPGSPRSDPLDGRRIRDASPPVTSESPPAR